MLERMKVFCFSLLILLSATNRAQDVPENIIKEAYSRMQYDLRVSHILVELDKEASPQDTLAAYKKAIDIRERVLKGDSFEKVAVELSDDPSAREHTNQKTNKMVKGNSGDIGYFSALDMVYPFETAAYNTPSGEVSLPVRTDFGYHLIKVIDRRPALGRVKVAYIYIKLPENADSEDIHKAKLEIDKVYEKLKAGKEWYKLAKKNSRVRNTAIRFGQSAEFGVNLMPPEYILAIYSLREIGDISEPFFTTSGWFIVKLLSRKAVGTYEEEKAKLIKRIIKSKRYVVKTDLKKDRVENVLATSGTNSFSVSNFSYISGEGYMKYNFTKENEEAIYAKEGFKFIIVKGDFSNSDSEIRFKKKDINLLYKEGNEFLLFELYDVNSQTILSSKKAEEQEFTYFFHTPATMELFFEVPEELSGPFVLKFADTIVNMDSK